MTGMSQIVHVLSFKYFLDDWIKSKNWVDEIRVNIEKNQYKANKRVRKMQDLPVVSLGCSSAMKDIV